MDMNQLDIDFVERRIWELEASNEALKDKNLKLHEELEQLKQAHRGCEERLERLRSGLFELDNV